MSISTVSHSSIIEESNPNPIHSIQQWAEIALSITTIAVGVVINAPFAAGTFVGLSSVIVSIIIILPISHFLEKKGAIDVDDEQEKKNDELIQRHPYFSGSIAPCIEEGFFRGLLQPACQQLAFLALPISMPTAMTLGICLQAFIFGVVHIFNHSENNISMGLLHGLSAFSSGILYGALYETAGFSACIAAHMTFNTTLLTFDKMIELLSPSDEIAPLEEASTAQLVFSYPKA